jgi:hypothetical protein
MIIWILRRHYKAPRGIANEWQETFTVVGAYPTRAMAAIEAKRKTSDFSNYHFTVQKLTVKPIT